ncbi:uncharacterized protein LOC105929847 [Fundulus heteroclitus]|uniref:uncharacterized protein LOC105929847 n=1 Tax=Fundulus heteroclitus TaxID=8078 RepID=UPI00165BBEB7|nr:uncharacterized protein LOC105929847 [Fundulus heteroclitus]
MAEVRRCAGRETGVKMLKCYLLENRTQRGTKSVRAGSLSAGFLLGDIKSCERNREEAAPGSRRDGYAKVSQLPSGAEAGAEKVNRRKKRCYVGPTGRLCSNGTLTELTNRNAPRYRSCNKFWRTFPLHLDPGSPQFVFTRYYGGDTSRSEPLHRTRTGYYDVLEVSPSATQAQIKTAYYKQSFAFHPDRNSGSEEATVRFSEISEAYMVLGNKSLRKKYDTGLLSLSDLVARAKPAGGASSGVSGEQQAGSSRSAAGAALRERVFDFDEFYKAHYSGQLQRQREIRYRKEEMLKKKQERAGEKKLGRMMEIGVGMLLVSAAGIILSLR